MSGYKPIMEPEFPASNIIRSFAELVNDRQKLHDFLVTLSIEELRILQTARNVLVPKPEPGCINHMEAKLYGRRRSVTAGPK